MQQRPPLFLVAGKSAGHIIPCLTLAKNYADTPTFFFSTNAPLDNQLLANNTAISKHIPLTFGSWGRTRWWHIPHVAFYGTTAFFSALYYGIRHRPEKVISTGGLVSIPVCAAAFILRIPIELFELNKDPGAAIQFLAPLATTIAYCFKSSASWFDPKKRRYTPYPIRFTKNYTASRSHLLERFNLKPDRTTILILGGSQGSVSLNHAVGDWLITNHSLPVQVIHQTGEHDQTNWQKKYADYGIPAHVVTYTNNVEDFYASADIIICRSGAGTLFETIFYKKPCITIPLELANNSHQKDNARALAAEYPDLIYLVLQNDLKNNPHLLSNLILHHIGRSQHTQESA